jgi:chromosomal replication initiator protein
VADAVAARVGVARYALWFHGNTLFLQLGNQIVVAVRNKHSQDWLEHTFGTAVKDAINEVCGRETAVRWVVDENRFSDSCVASGEDHPPAISQNGKLDPAATVPSSTGSTSNVGTHATPSPTDLFGDPLPRRKPRPRFAEASDLPSRGKVARRWKSLHDLVVGPCNRVAHASAISVVEEPGVGANPLVIHGPVGTGKTHVLEGIFTGLKRQPGQSPRYVTAEEFTTRFVAASQQGKMGSFRRHFRDCSALLLDDLHFLATKKATQAEFLHTFDALLADGRQVAVTTDCHPRLADELMPELVDRLLGGAVWGLLPPDEVTRLDILRHKAAAAKPAIPDMVLKTLATTLRGNVRELEGAIHGLRHYANVTGRPVDGRVLSEALGDLLRHAVRVVTFGDVDAAVRGVLRLADGTLQSKSRAWVVTHPRMIAIYLCRKHTAATYGEISKHFGAKTHSTAVAAEKKVRCWLERNAGVAIGDRDWNTKELIDRIERELQV